MRRAAISGSFAFVLLSAAPCDCVGAPPSDPAAKAVRQFYSMYHERPFPGLATKKELENISPFFSASLLNLMKRAQAEQERCRNKYPDEKPPWIEGDMFSSNFEGFTAFEAPNHSGETARGREVIVSFAYSGRRGSSKWRDEIALVNENGRWVIDDVRYRAPWAFKNGFGDSLRRSLSGMPACD